MSQMGNKLVATYYYDDQCECGTCSIKADVFLAWDGDEINNSEYYEVYNDGVCLTEGSEPYDNMPTRSEVAELLRVKDILP